MPTPSQRPLWQIYLIFLAPMVLSNFLQSFSGTLNGIYVGQLLGTQALAAVSGMFPVVFFFIALVIGLGGRGVGVDWPSLGRWRNGAGESDYRVNLDPGRGDWPDRGRARQCLCPTRHAGIRHTSRCAR